MTRSLFCGIILLAGCAPAPQEEAAPAPPAITLADLAGTWNLVTYTDGGDTVASVLSGTADPNSWTVAVAGRDPIPTHITVEGDSIMTHSGPFESVLRPGVMVETSNVVRLVDGKLVGTLRALYSGQADSVMTGRVEGTKQ